MYIISVVFANHPFPEDRQGLCLSFSPKKLQRTWPLSIFRLPKHLSILMSICQHLRHAHWVTRTSMTCWTRSKPPMRRSLGILSAVASVQWPCHFQDRQKYCETKLRQAWWT